MKGETDTTRGDLVREDRTVGSEKAVSKSDSRRRTRNDGVGVDIDPKMADVMEHPTEELWDSTPHKFSPV
jgi:hypothetical protein